MSQRSQGQQNRLSTAQRPVEDDRMRGSIGKYFEPWKINYIDAPETAFREEDAIREVYNPSIARDHRSEFILSSNWILRPDGLEEFFKRAKELFPEDEITYDTKHGAFQVKCPPEEQDNRVLQLNGLINDIVRHELENVPVEMRIGQFGGDKSKKIMHITDWRLETPSDEESVAYGKYSYPNSYSEYAFKSTWRIPDDQVGCGLTIQQLLRDHEIADLLKSTRGKCSVVSGLDNVSLHIGANSSEDMELLRKKADNLVEYFGSSKQTNSFFHVFYAEDAKWFKLELRYLYHLDPYLLRTFLLDYTKFSLYPPTSDYRRLFSKGSCVRMRAFHPKDTKFLETSFRIPKPAVSEDDISKPFKPAQDYKYTLKKRDWDEGIPHVVPFDARFLPVNPQAAPNVWAWTNDVALYERPEPPSPGFTEDTTAHIPKIDAGNGSSSYTNGQVTSLGAKQSDVSTSNRFASKYRDYPQMCINRNTQTTSPPTTNASSQQPRSMSLNPPRGSKLEIPRPSRLYVDDEPADSHATRLNDDRKSESWVPPHKRKTFSLASQKKPTNSQPVLGGGIGSISVSQQSHYHNCNAARELANALTIPEAEVWPSSPNTQHEMTLMDMSPPKHSYGSSSSWLQPLQPMRSTQPTPQITRGRQEDRDFHTTMKQQARPTVGTRQQTQTSDRIPPHRTADPDSNLVGRIATNVMSVLRPFRMFCGRVELKAEIGRLAFTKVNFAHINVRDRQKLCVYDIAGMEERLKEHVSKRDPLFSNMVSTIASDAEYIASLKQPDNPRNDMWGKPSGTRAFYELSCSTTGTDGVQCPFVLEIDAGNFSYQVYRANTTAGVVCMHCVKRTFDVQFTIDAFEDLQYNCGGFVKELIDTLEVKPESEDGLGPEIDFFIHNAWAIQLHCLRLRSVTSYPDKANTCQLQITQCQEMSIDQSMDPKIDGRGMNYHAKPLQQGSRERPFPIWYETCIRSIKADQAFAENPVLGFAEAAKWTAEGLKSSFAFRELIQAAADVVKQIDGVAFFCDNQERFPRPPISVREASTAEYEDTKREHGNKRIL